MSSGDPTALHQGMSRQSKKIVTPSYGLSLEVMHSCQSNFGSFFDICNGSLLLLFVCLFVCLFVLYPVHFSSSRLGKAGAMITDVPFSVSGHVNPLSHESVCEIYSMKIQQCVPLAQSQILYIVCMYVCLFVCCCFMCV